MTVPVSIHYRPMQPSDLAAVYAIETAAYAFPWTQGNFADCLESGYRCEVMLEGEGQGEVPGEVALVGYSILAPMVDEAHVLNCCVAPACQGRGLGRQMMLHLISRLPHLHLPSTGLPSLLLEVRPSNAAAVHLYTDLGFCEIGRRRGYYPATAEEGGREDALVMRYPDPATVTA